MQCCGVVLCYVVSIKLYCQPPKQGSAKKKLTKAEKEKLKQEEEERKALEEGLLHEGLHLHCTSSL